MKKIVLAFSGGLDTSFCVPYLIEKGFDVYTIFINSGGISQKQEKIIEKKAYQLGAKEHVSKNVEKELCKSIVTPLLWSDSVYQNKYPILCSDRYLIVQEMVNLCKKLKTNYISHGCTGMGNDQVRFDLSIHANGNFKIITPIREIQKEYKNIRDHELSFLKEKGFKVPNISKKYSVNENLLGVTISGSEIDSFDEPSVETYVLCNPPEKQLKRAKKIVIEFNKGNIKSINGVNINTSDAVKNLNKIGGKYGIGREIVINDTIIGIKGRIVFEAPGISLLKIAHQALEEAVLTAKQNEFKKFVGNKWVELLYQGFYFDPLRKNLETFLKDTQSKVTGKVTLELNAGKADAVKIDSRHILNSKDATYAQSASWSIEESQGFIKLFGLSTKTWSEINK